MKTVAAKKLNLTLETLRTLNTDDLDRAVGGVAKGIVSTDTPSFCFECKPRLPKPVQN